MSWKPRYTVLSVLFCAFLLCYVDRMVMASAIPFIAKDFNLSPLAMGGVLSAFFAGYALMQIPGGLLADRFGPRAVLTVSVAWWSLMTALTGMASGLTALLVIRVLFGLGEGPFPAAASKTLAIWFPARELGRANGLQQASTALGATVAPLIVVAMIASFGWRSVFYLLFLPGLILTAVVWRYVRNSQYAAEHPISGNSPPSVKASWLQSAKTPAVLWCAVCLFLANVVAWGLMNWLPTYLLQARGFSMEKMGVFAAVTNLAGALGFVAGGYLCDRYFSGRLSIPIGWGLVTSAGFTYLAAIAPTGEWAVACLAGVFFLSYIAFTALFTLPLVIVPKSSVGSAAGIVNTAGQLAGVVSPLLVGLILELTSGDFKVVLYCMVGLALMALYPASRIRQSPLHAT
jgi:MFS family permease